MDSDKSLDLTLLSRFVLLRVDVVAFFVVLPLVAVSFESGDFANNDMDLRQAMPKRQVGIVVGIVRVLLVLLLPPLRLLLLLRIEVEKLRTPLPLHANKMEHETLKKADLIILVLNVIRVVIRSFVCYVLCVTE